MASIDLLDHKQCAICGRSCADENEARLLRITAGSLNIGERGIFLVTALDEERAFGCGQHHNLTLVERFLDRGTFAPADHNQAPEPLTMQPEEHATEDVLAEA